MKPTSFAARIECMLDCGAPSMDNLYKKYGEIERKKAKREKKQRWKKDEETRGYKKRS